MSDRQRIVWLDEDYDRSCSSDGVSRYGAYLRQRSGWLDNGGPLSAVEFASVAWQIATGPIMSPPFVRRSSDVHQMTCQRDEGDPDVLVAQVRLPLPHPAQVWDMRAAGWRDWARERAWSDEPGPLVEPEQLPRLLFTATFTVAIPAGSLPAPTSTRVDVALATHAVATVCGLVNRKMGPDLESLLIRWQERRGGAR